MFIWPTDVRRITSGFRSPNRPKHHGTDIAMPGTHKIYAAAAGTVSRSYRSNTYGECIFILHWIDGQVWETVYAHLKDGFRLVPVGQKVKQGQSIGFMGNTGTSSGQHLHFEIHKGRWNVNKTNAVDPVKYLTEYGNKKEDLSDGFTYTVKPGDTLSKIASDHNMTLNQIADLNGIKNKNLVYPGQVLQLKINIYTVKKGDTLSAIAKRNKTTIGKIINTNKIKDPDRIYAGQKIKLP